VPLQKTRAFANGATHSSLAGFEGLPLNDGAVLCRQRVKRGVYLLISRVPIRKVQRGSFHSIAIQPPTAAELTVGDLCHDLWINDHLRGPVIKVSHAVGVAVVRT